MSLLIDATVSNVNQLIKILLLRSLRLSFVRFGVTCDEYSVEFLQNLGPKARTWLSKFFFRITRFTRHWVLMACIKQQTAAWPGVQVPDLCGLMAMQAIHTVALWFDPPTVPPGQANGNDINEDVHEIMQQKHTFSTVVAVHVVIC